MKWAECDISKCYSSKNEITEKGSKQHTKSHQKILDCSLKIPHFQQPTLCDHRTSTTATRLELAGLVAAGTTSSAGREWCTGVLLLLLCRLAGEVPWRWLRNGTAGMNGTGGMGQGKRPKSCQGPNRGSQGSGRDAVRQMYSQHPPVGKALSIIHFIVNGLRVSDSGPRQQKLCALPLLGSFAANLCPRRDLIERQVGSLNPPLRSRRATPT